MRRIAINGFIVLSLLLLMGIVGCSMNDHMSNGTDKKEKEVVQEISGDEPEAGMIIGEAGEVTVDDMDEELVLPDPDVPEDDDDASMRAYDDAIKVYKNADRTGPYKWYKYSKARLNDTWDDGTKVSDSISCIYVKYGYEVIVFRYGNYCGDYTLLRPTSSSGNYWTMSKISISDGKTMDDRITSFEIRRALKVKSVINKGQEPKDSEMGSRIYVQSMQGIVGAIGYWYLCKENVIYRTDCNNMTLLYNSTSIKNLPFGGLREYDHFGAMDYYDGKLYVALSKKGGGKRPLVIVYDSDLKFKGYYRFPLDKQDDVSWVAINPGNGLLYSTDEYKKLKAYKMPGLHPKKYGMTMTYLFSVKLDFGSLGHSPGSWWDNVWNQGGAFDPYGNFFYTLDHAREEYSKYTGVYIFEITGRKSKVKWRLPIKYDPDYFNGKWRRGELEGLTLYSRADGKYPGDLHQLFLNNEGGEDDMSVINYEINYGQK